ncbi:hypothetical protein FRC10_004431 [Ceratobasidium sp. 414]|nr:hypothetical protein FRC10_004431 [Ceratobasidium sp. 414]
MQQAISAGRTLRSALDTRLLTTGSWNSSGNVGVSSLSFSRTSNEDIPRLSSRLSQRLTFTGRGNNSVVSHTNGTRKLTSRVKNQRTKKLEAKKSSLIRAKLKTSTGRPEDSSGAQPQWTAVSAALTSLEESIARTNLLLHSLASGEAWARRTRSRPRLSWEAKAALESAPNQKSPDPTQTTEALTALLQELGQKQAMAVDLLSRLNRPTTGALPTTSPKKTFEDILVNKSANRSSEPQTNGGLPFESGWGPDTLVPSPAENPTPVPEPLPKDTAMENGARAVVPGSAGELQGTIEPDTIALECQFTQAYINAAFVPSHFWIAVIRDSEHVVPVPTLQHGLDRVLFNPGVHWLQDPNSRVYNFPPELQAMPAFTSFAYERVNTFITSSKDTELADLAKRQGKKFTGSTSSVSMILAHLYFLISSWRDVDTSVLSASFAHMSKEFSAGQKMPYTFFMRQNNGVVAFDSGSQTDDPFNQNILSYIGIMLEKLLTLSREDFETLLRNNSAVLGGKTVLPEREAYRIDEADILKVQVDGTAVATGLRRQSSSWNRGIRFENAGSHISAAGCLECGGYQIRSATGPFESFEREYYDLCRSALLKYSFQARIGAMDGVFVLYHNTSRMFGFQYLPLKEMDERLFGGHEGGERVFRACLGFLEVVAENVTSCFPGQDIKATIYTNESKEPELSVWVEPAEWNEPTPGPVYELRLNLYHTINGEPIAPGAHVTFEKPDWKINYKLTRLAPSAETRAGRDRAFARQQAIRISCLPEGTTVEELSNRMKDGVLEGYAPRTTGNTDVVAEAIGDGVSSSTLDAWNKRFRARASPFVRSLRELSKKGLEDLDKWTKDESPKVVYKPRV